jgi:hypothetical protein
MNRAWAAKTNTKSPTIPGLTGGTRNYPENKYHHGMCIAFVLHHYVSFKNFYNYLSSFLNVNKPWFEPKYEQDKTLLDYFTPWLITLDL